MAKDWSYLSQSFSHLGKQTNKQKRYHLKMGSLNSEYLWMVFLEKQFGIKGSILQ